LQAQLGHSHSTYSSILTACLRTAAVFCALQLAVGPSYGQSYIQTTDPNDDTVPKHRRLPDSPNFDPSEMGYSKTVCPYFGRRLVKLPPPPPVNAVINSSLDSDGSQFLIPFQGQLGAAPANASASGRLPKLSTIVPTDIDYGPTDIQDNSAAPPMYANANANRTIVSNSNGTSPTATISTTPTTKTANAEDESKTPEVAPISWPGRAARSASSRPENHKDPVKLFATVSRDDQFGVRIDDLLACALARNTKMKDIDRSVAHFHTRKSKTFDGLKDSMDEAIDYKGFSRSMEAADVILDKNVSAKSAESSEYIKQRYVDQLHPKIVSRVMQIAMGMGLDDKERGKEITDSGIKALSELVGEKQAKNTAAMLRDWSEHVSIPPEVFQQQQWDVEAYRSKVNMATKIAMNSDPTVTDIVKAIRKFDRRSITNKAYGAANTMANLAEIAAPGLAIPAGIEVLRGGMVQANGGSEPKKLLKELYYDKRIESRYRTINQESELAITDYQLALARHNPVLLACAESVLSQLIGPECITDVLDSSIFHPDTKTENTQMLEAERSVIVR
jgi:hypothetical protein